MIPAQASVIIFRKYIIFSIIVIDIAAFIFRRGDIFIPQLLQFESRSRGRVEVAVFHYKAIDKRREDHSETGTVLANTEEEARQKLKLLNLDNVRIKRLGRFLGFWKSFTVDVK